MKRIVQSRSKSPSRALRRITSTNDSTTRSIETRSDDSENEIESPRVDTNAKRRRSRHTIPIGDPLHYELVHTIVKQSPLTTSEIDKTSMFGVINLAALLLVIHNLRLVVENLLKHGWLYGSFLTQNFGLLIEYSDVACLVCLACVAVISPLIMLKNEQLLIKKRISLNQNRIIALTTCAATLILPTLTILSWFFFRNFSFIFLNF